MASFYSIGGSHEVAGRPHSALPTRIEYVHVFFDRTIHAFSTDNPGSGSIHAFSTFSSLDIPAWSYLYQE